MDLITLLLVFFLISLPIGIYIICKRPKWTRLQRFGGIFLWIVSVLLFCMESLLVYLHAEPMFAKPIIYLYPEDETNVTVKVSHPEKFTCEYPKYNEGWNVYAKPNGKLKDLGSGKNLYCLYYESKAFRAKIQNDGFVVKSADIADFLDEKLEFLGLNYKERNEFIIYWLPKLEQSPYIYIRFLTTDELAMRQQLSITPTPDTLIRVMMTYKRLNKPIEVEEQELDPVVRNGFVAVEWGGMEIK